MSREMGVAACCHTHCHDDYWPNKEIEITQVIWIRGADLVCSSVRLMRLFGCQGPSLRSDAAGGYAALDRLIARFLQHNMWQERHALSAESAQRRHNGGEQLMLVSLRASTELPSNERETGTILA